VSSRIGIDNVFEFLEKLSEGARGVAEREQALVRQYRLKKGDLEKAHEEALSKCKESASEALAKAEAVIDGTTAGIDAHYERRKARIAQAHRTTIEASLAKIEEMENRGKGRVQKGLLATSRGREADIKAQESARVEFSETIVERTELHEELKESGYEFFTGFGKFQNELMQEAEDEALEPDLKTGSAKMLEELQTLHTKTEEDFARYRRKILSLFFRGFPVWLLILLIIMGHGVAFFVGPQYDAARFTPLNIGLSCGVAIAGALVLYFLGMALAARSARAIITSVRRMDRVLLLAELTNAEENRLNLERIETEAEARTQELQAEWKAVQQEAQDQRQPIRDHVDAKEIRITGKHEKLHRERLRQAKNEHDAGIKKLKGEQAAEEKKIVDDREKEAAERESTYAAAWERLIGDWNAVVKPAYKNAAADLEESEKVFAPWDDPAWSDWSPPADFLHETRFARMEVTMEKLCSKLPEDERLALPGSSEFTFPFSLSYPKQGCLLFESDKHGREEMIGSLNNVILRLLANSPPGRASLTVFDPVGLGQSFAGIMHLADYGEHLINSKIWTQSGQIEQRLTELNEHIEKVIQMYLRNEYETIVDYNREAGNIAEKYHFLVIADFPVNFTPTAANRLMSIVATGAKCGVFTLIHWDRRQPKLDDNIIEELRANSICVNNMGMSFALKNKMITGARLRLDPAPSPEFAMDLIHKVGKQSVDSNRIEVPFKQVAPTDEQLWSRDTTNELVVPVGRTGATKLQNLSIGKGTCQHALIAGKTGSGKSTLFHVIVTNLSLWCSPEQVEFYLIDFKKGVEFKCYATRRLPHAKVIAIESDREFGLSVLRRLDEELRERGELFRELGAQDVAGYKKAGGKRAMPRTLLMVDEFQEYFVEDDKIAQEAALLLDRIVRQGRAFGMHVILGSQTLGGAFTLARATLGQMVIRVALQCNEADSYLILDDTNPAARLLTRPGEGIYNDNAGAPEGNHPFQIVWLPDEVRDSYLDKVAVKVKESGREFSTPVVFEGNAPADVAENDLLRKMLKAESVERQGAVSAYLGAPNSIKGPTEAVFQRQSGSNLIVVGQREEATMAMLAVSMISLSSQFPKGAAKFVLLDGSPPESSEKAYMERVVGVIPHEVITPKYSELGEVMGELEADMKIRDEGGGGVALSPRVFVLIHGLQRFKKLRFEEDFSFSLDDDDDKAANPGTALNNLILEGASAGLHIIATCDTLNNVNRSLSRKALTEFEMRVIFQMSANDSATLIDSPKGGDLGLNRALLYNEQEGYLETFRPYALPPFEWIEKAGESLKCLIG
jgi:S-DNA-T family DNA segregation ATPase FtsK/SpoIIIE